MSNTNKPVHWAVVGLGWVATDFVAPGIVKSPGSELVACLGSTPEKSRAFADKFKVARTHPDLESLARDPDVDAVLMDVMMPEMDGYETTMAIRAMDQFKALPIIALTAKAMKGDREKCIAAGASDYITKPVDTEQLLSLLRVWLYR